jgi:hypothetical protein
MNFEQIGIAFLLVAFLVGFITGVVMLCRFKESDFTQWWYEKEFKDRVE